VNENIRKYTNLNENTNNPNQFWSTLKNMSTKQINSQDKSIPVDKLFSHFQRLHSKPVLSHYSDAQRDIAKDLEEKEKQTLLVSEIDKPISESEVRKAVKLLNLKKAAGLDRVQNEMLKSGIN